MTAKGLPPGRLGLPWLGETLSIMRSNHGFYQDRLARYGPIFKTRLFGNDFVVFTGHAAFHQFATDPRIERGDADPISIEHMFRGSLALIDGDDHLVRKTVMLRGVGYRSAIESQVPRMQELTEQLVDGWTREKRPVHVLRELQRFAGRLTCAMYLGEESEELAREVDEAADDVRGAFMTLPLAVPGSKYATAKAGRDRLERIVDDAIVRHQQRRYDDIVSRMLDAAATSDVPVEALKGDIRHMIFAGQGGFFLPLGLATMAIAQNPEILARAAEEVTAIAPAGPITMDQLERLVYLEQISKEVRRFFALNSATFFGRFTEDTDIAGYRIPKGWGAIGGIHINMRNPDVFADPDRFDPDRFAPAAESALPPGSYVPHGGGAATRHRCPGENIVTVATQVYLTVLLRTASEWTMPAQDLTLTNELFPVPASGIIAEFQPRVPAAAG